MNVLVIAAWVALISSFIVLVAKIVRLPVKGHLPGYGYLAILLALSWVILVGTHALPEGGAGAALTVGAWAFIMIAAVTSIYQRVAGRVKSRTQTAQTATISQVAAESAPAPVTEDSKEDILARYVPPPTDSDPGIRLATGLSIQADISYHDYQGAPSRRRVTIQHVYTHDTSGRAYEYAGYIKGWCHKSQAERTFNIDRIDELVDSETGEIVESPVKWIEQVCGLTVPLAPFRRVHLDPIPPPVTFTWQRGPHDLEIYDLRIDEIHTVDGHPVLIAGRGHRRPGGRRRAASGSYRFDLAPLPEDLSRPIAIRWREDTKDQADVIGWVRRLLGDGQSAST